MISFRNQGSIVNAAVFGEFTLAEYRQFEEAVDYTLGHYGARADLLVDLTDMTGFTLDVAWQEIRFSRRHAHDFRRIALVTGSEWVAWSAWIPRAFVDAEMRVFDDADLALAWIRDEEGPVIFNRLVTTEQLAARLGDAQWVVCDCRHDLMQPEVGANAYAVGHLPGAFFLHLDRDLSGPTNGTNGRHPLPDPDVFARRMADIGVGPATQVVAYDDSGGPYAARLWWMLRWIGHDAVAVLDGGFGKWKSEGRDVIATPPTVAARGTLTARRRESLTVDAAFVLEHLGDPAWLVVDARAPERFRGESEPVDPVAGHIPGARNRLFKDNLTPGGVFKSPSELHREFMQVIGNMPSTHVVNQCGSGVTAAHNVLALEVAGLGGSRLYPGSWSEWCADPSRPVARGA